MLGSSRNCIFSDPNLATFPGLAIVGAVLAVNLVGDGMRDALDARLKWLERAPRFVRLLALPPTLRSVSLAPGLANEA